MDNETLFDVETGKEKMEAGGIIINDVIHTIMSNIASLLLSEDVPRDVVSSVMAKMATDLNMGNVTIRKRPAPRSTTTKGKKGGGDEKEKKGRGKKIDVDRTMLDTIRKKRGIENKNNIQWKFLVKEESVNIKELPPSLHDAYYSDDKRLPLEEGEVLIAYLDDDGMKHTVYYVMKMRNYKVRYVNPIEKKTLENLFLNVYEDEDEENYNFFAL